MRTVCGLLTVLLILGPIGMGILFNVDAPLLEDISSTDEVESPSPEAHGTRGAPVEGPRFVNLYFHSGNVINTTVPWQSTSVTTTAGTVTFTSDISLTSKLWVGDKIGVDGMKAQVNLSGNGDVTVNVYEDEGGTLVGSGVHSFTNAVPELETFEIHFEPELNFNYNFSSGHDIVVEFILSGAILTPSLVYGSTGRQSSLRLYCKPVTDIEVKTYNFIPQAVTKFYPYNIDKQVNRRQVQIKGAITDAFGNNDVQDVNIEIEDPDGGTINMVAKWDLDTGIYNDTWFYPAGSTEGKYTVTTEIVLEQGQTLSSSNTFNMSEYGVLLTSPDRVGGEGSSIIEAERNIIQNETTSYHINVINIGAKDINVDIITSLTTPEKTYWDWVLGGTNITLDPGDKSGEVKNLEPGWGKRKGILLTIDGTNKALEDYVGISVQAVCSEETSEKHSLFTWTKVVVRYDLELEFLDDTKEQTKNVDMGSEVEYDFRVENTGGADDYIWFELGTPPGGWGMTLSGTKTDDPKFGQWGYVHLAPKDNAPLKLTLTTPTSGGDVTGIIDIIGKSYGSLEQGDDPVESDKITTTTIMTSGVMLEVIGQHEKDATPGDDVVYNFQLTNTGTTTANFTVTFDQPSSSDGWDLGDISFQQGTYDPEENVQLSPNNHHSFQLIVAPTIEVLAQNYTITVTAVNDEAPQSRYDVKNVYCIVNEYHDIEVIEPIGLVLYGEAEPGEDVEYVIEIKNNGNVAELVTIDVDEPGGWEVDFGNASSGWTEEIEPQDMETVTLVLTVPDDAEGDQTVDILVSVIPVERPEDRIDIETHTEIKGSFTQTLFTLLVPILLFIVIIVMVVVIYKRR